MGVPSLAALAQQAAGGPLGGGLPATMLEPGVYTIIEVHPAGFIDSLDTPGKILDVFGKVVEEFGDGPDTPGNSVAASGPMLMLGGTAAGTAGSRVGMAVNSNTKIDPQVLSQLMIDPKNDAIIRIQMNAGEQGTEYNFSEVRITRPPIPTPDPDPDPKPLPDPIPATPFDPPPLAYLPPPPVFVPSSGFDLFGHTGGYTWHLSVVNGGHPRRDGLGNYPNRSDPNDPRFDPLGWSTVDLGQSQWLIAYDQSVFVKTVKRVVYGTRGGIPLAGDFNGDGVDEVGVFVDGYWYLDLNGNGVWDDGDVIAQLGRAGDQPVVGDWDGDGKADIGIFGAAWIGDMRAVERDPGLPDASNESTHRYKNVPPRIVDFRPVSR